MKILIIDSYYSGFLKYFYSKNKDILNLSYSKHLSKLIQVNFGTSDYYSYYLNKAGHKAYDIVANDYDLQSKWALEHGLKYRKTPILSKLQTMPYIHRYIGRPAWIQDLVTAQVSVIKPDIVYVQDLSILNPKTLINIKKTTKLLVGQIACPLPAERNVAAFDLILTSFPHYVKKIKKIGVNSEYFKIGFDPRVLKKIGLKKRIYDVVFIGSFSPNHFAGTKLLEELAAQIPVHVWGQGLEFLSPSSPLRKHFHGSAWGLEMYKILAQAKIVVNRHIGVAENNANNMRLYESTGMGAMLLTDHKQNMHELFNVGKEADTYRNSNELVKKAKYYLANEAIRSKMAKSGQKRTLSSHNYEVRMGELVNILNKYVK